MQKNEIVYLRCSCACGIVAFEKWEFGGSVPNSYGFSFLNSNLVSAHNSLFQRIRDASKILFGKPIYYADVSVEDASEIQAFLQKCLTLVD